MQPNQFFFPLTQETINPEPTQSKRMIELNKYNNIRKLHKRLTIPFIWSRGCCYEGTPTLYTLQIRTNANDVYYQKERLDEVDCFNIEIISFYTETLDPFEFNDNTFIPTLSPEQMQARYNRCQVIDPEESILLTKPSFENLTTVPYLWKRYSEESVELDFDEDDNIVLNGIKYERSFEVPTLHKIKKLPYHFKPTLHEVLTQLPDYLDEPFLVTTNMLSSDTDVMVQGNYHIGITTVYTPVIEQDNKKPRTGEYTAF